MKRLSHGSMVSPGAFRHRGGLRVLVCAVVIWLALPLCSDSRCLSAGSDSSEVLYRAVIEGLRENRQRLSCGYLAWEMKEKRPGGRDSRPELSGSFQMWWDGEKVTTRSMVDRLGGGHEGDWLVERSGEIKAFNGKEFRQVPNVDKPKDMAISKEPKFNALENWLQDARLTGPVAHERYVSYCMEAKNLKTKWSMSEKDGKKLIKFVVAETGGISGVFYYDPAKACSMVCEERYNEKGKAAFTQSNKVEQMGPGVWMPVATELKIFNQEDGTVLSERLMSVDLKQSIINDRSKIPENIFDIGETPDMEISDYRGGGRINYTMDVAPLSRELVQQEVQDFMSGSPDNGGVQLPAGGVDGNGITVKADKSGEAAQVPVGGEVVGEGASTTGAFGRVLKRCLLLAGTLLIIVGAFGWCRRARANVEGKPSARS